MRVDLNSFSIKSHTNSFRTSRKACPLSFSQWSFSPLTHYALVLHILFAISIQKCLDGKPFVYFPAWSSCLEVLFELS